mmetsp:Transcript_2501/g.6898  ORF Transcript_2501/g.6898 Transcript_2501/m.6898 type:complete len:92 (-) Transcript_2501:59-334(-)
MGGAIAFVASAVGVAAITAVAGESTPGWSGKADADDGPPPRCWGLGLWLTGLVPSVARLVLGGSGLVSPMEITGFEEVDGRMVGDEVSFTF